VTNPAHSAQEKPTIPQGLADEAIVARVRAGEVQLFELLMRRHNPRVFRVVRGIVHRDDEAEDVMQDAYVRAYDHLHDFRGEARFSTWLTRIAVHEALARVRRERRFEPFDTQEEHSAIMPNEPLTSPEQHASNGEVRELLQRSVDELPDDFRSVFVLREVEQLSGAETAACLGIPEETVKTRLFRARKRLQETMLRSLDVALPQIYEFHLSRCNRVVAAVMYRIVSRRSIDS
jgi:RNA polymerase sigma-70 factor, ECF subfamily